MSAKKLTGVNSFQPAVTVASRDAKLELSADTVSIHKSGIEFRSPTPFNEWSEMTVALQSPQDGSRLSCHGVIVACSGNKHTGYHVSHGLHQPDTAGGKTAGRDGALRVWRGPVAIFSN